MKADHCKAGWALSADALKLTVIIGVFIWLVMFLASRGQLLDFSVLYTSGGIVLEGHRTGLFDVQTQTEFQHRVLDMSGLLPFNHLAYESLLFVPLAMLPYKAALWIWRLMSAGMLLWATRILAGEFHGVRIQVLTLSLALYPIVLAIVQGQDSILLLLLLSASLAALSRKQERRAGVLLALALFKPHLVLPIAAVFIWKRGNGFVQGFLGGSAAVVGISIFVTGIRGLLQMRDLMRYAASGTGNQIGGFANSRPNLLGILGLSGLGEHRALMLSIIVSALLFALVVWLLRNQASPRFLFPPLIALSLLISIHVNAHDLSLLFIPLLAMLAQNKKSASICASACFCMPIFWFSGHSTLFFFVICAVLLLTIQQPESEAGEAVAAV